MILRKILIKKSPGARAVPLQNMSGLKRLLLLHDCTSECSVQTTPLKNLLPVKNHCRLELVCVAVMGHRHFFLHDPDGNCFYKETGLAQIVQISPNPSSPFLLTSSGNNNNNYHLNRVRKNADDPLLSRSCRESVLNSTSESELSLTPKSGLS